jgi:D-3-phosphoglycerate dehydrogenase
MTMKVLVADKIADSGIDKLREDYEVDVKTGLSEAELIDVIGDYDALIVRSATRATRTVIEAADKLKIIGRAGVGIDNVDVTAATERGIIVCNAPTSNVVSAAEHTWGLLMAQARMIPQANASLKSGKWERSKFTGAELYEKTLAIIGLGRIGTLIAERARAFQMRIIGYDPYISEERAAALGVELYSSIDELLAQADFITVHLPKTKETIGMFGPKQFAKMKDGVRLVNTARGGIYQTDALVDALKSGKVASAAIDVYEVEPTTESPLFALDNVIVTPHLGASTEEAQDRAGDQIAELVAAGLRGEMVSTAVNIAPVAPDVMDKVGPYLQLAEQQGAMVAQLAPGGVDSIEIVTVGGLAETDTRILRTAVLKGVLSVATDEPVNYVNADYFASQRGIEVTESKRTATHDYVSMIIVKAVSGGKAVEVAAALIGKRNEPRLVSLFGYDLDMMPDRYMAFFLYPDRPGMIGKVGTILGDAGVNIGSMQVGRHEAGGTALMGITVDTPLDAVVLSRIKDEAGMQEAWSVEL